MTTIRTRRWDPDQDDAQSLWERVNDGWRDLVIAFKPALPNAQVLREVTFTGGVATLSFAVEGVAARPKGVILVSLYRDDTGATSAVTLSWTYSNGMVTTTSFSGLAATTWRATFLVIGA